MFELIELAVRTVIEHLQTDLDDRIDAVNTLYENEDPVIVLDTIRSYSWSERSIVPETPAVLVLPEVSMALEDTQDVHFKASHWLQIIVVLTEQDTDVLKKRLFRTVLAIMHSLMALRSQGGNVQITWRDPYASYSPVYVNDENNLFADAQVNIDVIISEVNS